MARIIDDELQKVLLNYIGQRPYVEVAKLIAAIAQAPEYTPETSGPERTPKPQIKEK